MQNLRDELRTRGPEAKPLEFRAVTYRNGETPKMNDCHNNARRWVAEKPDVRSLVRGWLVSGGCVFDKHSAVEENGAVYDITPLRSPRTPFLRYLGSDDDFEKIPNQMIVSPVF